MKGKKLRMAGMKGNGTVKKRSKHQRINYFWNIRENVLYIKYLI